MAMERADPVRYAGAIDRAMTWMRGMQSANGGWGAFDVANDYDYLNHIPFADHGALLDPPTADVSARCLSAVRQARSEEHTSELQSLMRILYAVFRLKKKKKNIHEHI